MIINMTGGGGGASLNYKVVGGTTTPENPAENTIWVNTDAEITSHVFSATEPENPAEGMVWFNLGLSCSTPINLLKKGNEVWIYPTGVQQYVGGAWVGKTAQTRLNGEWINWNLVLLSAEINAGFTPYAGSNGSVTVNANTIVLNYNGEQNGWACVSTANPVDLSNYRKFTVKMNCSKYYNSEAFGGYAAVGAEAISTSNYARASDLTAGTRITTTGEYVDYAVDISSLSGLYYLGVWGVVAGTITDIWLE